MQYKYSLCGYFVFWFPFLLQAKALSSRHGDVSKDIVRYATSGTV